MGLYGISSSQIHLKNLIPRNEKFKKGHYSKSNWIQIHAQQLYRHTSIIHLFFIHLTWKFILQLSNLEPTTNHIQFLIQYRINAKIIDNTERSTTKQWIIQRIEVISCTRTPVHSWVYINKRPVFTTNSPFSFTL